jgi:3-dehydroquinate synthase
LREITVALNPPYTARVERGSLARAGAWAKPHLASGGRAFVVTVPPVRRHWGAALDASLAAAGLPAVTLELPDGEAHKRLASLEALADAMLAHGAARDALVIAFGGGVAGDVAAFLASIYMRGVALLHVPTSLVAMIDSSLGGKTAVNLAGGKNLLGTFYHPRSILVDPALLATLPEREYRSGLAEAIKYALIADRPLLEAIERDAAGLRALDPAVLDPLIAASLEHKARIVVADEREGDRRRILNYGHTFGHALESATGYAYFLHGEAVAWGMLAAGRLALRLGRWPAADQRRAEAAILALCGPLPPITAAPEAILAAMAGDKKARAGELHFVLPAALGRVEVVSGIARGEILAALADTAALAATAPPAPPWPS